MFALNFSIIVIEVGDRFFTAVMSVGTLVLTIVGKQVDHVIHIASIDARIIRFHFFDRIHRHNIQEIILVDLFIRVAQIAKNGRANPY